ncbi:hypothetical protein HGRIS_004391 [Hohenbuehelia grisea]|uniref:Uncharacterized protein n=1 Tax=Hohenbuehelia grisea TaxID=104357 RepID=A0ABR3JC41_9AGAR
MGAQRKHPRLELQNLMVSALDWPQVADPKNAESMPVYQKLRKPTPPTQEHGALLACRIIGAKGSSTVVLEDAWCSQRLP